MLYRSGASVGFYRGDVKLLVDDIKTLHPTMFAVVPRLLNKIYAAVMGRINSSGAFKRWLFNKAYTAKLNKLRRTNVNVHGFYDSLVFQNIAASLGGCVRIMITGSAPLSSTVMEFLRICLSCEVLEGYVPRRGSLHTPSRLSLAAPCARYGQTETSAASHITLPGDMSMGHVGVPLPCLEVKLDSVPEMDYTVTDAEGPRGEVCFRGPNVFQGYFEDPEKTAAAVVDGWLHSGDIGRINPDGTLSIIDRRKNLFKLAQGEYVSPEKVENVYIQHPVVEQVCRPHPPPRFTPRLTVVPWCGAGVGARELLGEFLGRDHQCQRSGAGEVGSSSRQSLWQRLATPWQRHHPHLIRGAAVEGVDGPGKARRTALVRTSQVPRLHQRALRCRQRLAHPHIQAPPQRSAQMVRAVRAQQGMAMPAFAYERACAVAALQLHGYHHGAVQAPAWCAPHCRRDRAIER